MNRFLMIVASVVTVGCSKPDPAPAASPHPAATRDLGAASQRFRAALPTGKVATLLAPQVLIENSNAHTGCKEAAEPCVKDTLAATEAERRLTQETEGFTFTGPDGAAKDLGCDARCCSYGPFKHGDMRVAIAVVCFDDSIDPKISTIVSE